MATSFEEGLTWYYTKGGGREQFKTEEEAKKFAEEKVKELKEQKKQEQPKVITIGPTSGPPTKAYYQEKPGAPIQELPQPTEEAIKEAFRKLPEGAVPVSIEKSGKEIVLKYQPPQTKTDLENLVREKQQIQGRIGYDIPRVVQPAELEKILASGATLYRVPVPKDLSKYTITQLQQREDFLGFGTYDKEAVMWFTKQPSHEELNKIFGENRKAFASEVVSKWSPTEVAATKAALVASPEGFGFFGSIVAKYAGLKTGMSPEEYMLNKVREAQAEIKSGREAQYIAKGALFSLGSPVGLPVTAYATGVMMEPIASGISSSIMQSSNIATRIIGTGTLLGTSAALTGIPIASSIKAIKEGQADVGIGGLTAITEIGIGAKIGTTHMAGWEAQQKQLAIQKELETQLKETRFIQRQTGNTFKGVATIESAKEIRVVNVPDLAKGGTTTIISFQEPRYNLQGSIKTWGISEEGISTGKYSSIVYVYEGNRPIATEFRLEDFLSKSTKIAEVGIGETTKFYYTKTTPLIRSTSLDWELHSTIGITKQLAVETENSMVESYSAYGIGRYRNEIAGVIRKITPIEHVKLYGMSFAGSQSAASTSTSVQTDVANKVVESAIDNAVKSVSSNVPSAGMSSAITAGAIAPTATKTEVKTESLTSVETAQVSGQQLNTKEIVTTIQNVETPSKSKEKIGTVTVEGMKNIEQESVSFGQIQVPIQVQIQEQTQKQAQAVATTTTTTAPPVPPAVPVSVQVPPVTVPLPPLSIGLPSFGGRKIAIATTSKVFKDIQKYKPSLYSLMKGLKIRMPTEITKAVYRPKIGKVKIV